MNEAERAATEYADGAWLDGDGPRAWDLRKFGFQAGWLAAWELATAAEQKRCAAIARAAHIPKNTPAGRMQLCLPEAEAVAKQIARAIEEQESSDGNM